MPSGTLYRVALVGTAVLENISLPSSGCLKVTGFHSCVTVELLLISLWNPITLRNPEDGSEYSPKRQFELKLHSTKSQKASIIDITVKASQKAVLWS
jgi:hypothetical protein